MTLMRVTYMSRPTPSVLQPDFGVASRALAAQSIRDNLRNKLTGALIVDPLWFVQTIERERARLMPVFLRILKDGRHSDVRIFEMATVRARLFQDWALHVGELSRIDPAIALECVEGYQRHASTHARTIVNALHRSTAHPSW